MEKIIDKIRKLQALKDGAEKVGSIEEAANAAEKVQRLLLKHNLSMADLGRYTVEVNTPQMTTVSAMGEFNWQKREGMWLFTLASVVGDFYLCKIVLSQGVNDVMIRYIGREDNTLTAIAAMKNLVSQIKYLEKIAYKKVSFEKRGSFRRAFYQGAVIGLNQAIRVIQEERKKQENIEVEPGVNLPMVMVDKLVKQTREENEKFALDKFGSLRNGRKTTVKRSSMGLGMGYREGLNLRPNTSIE